MADGESKRGRDRPYWLPFVIALVMWIWLTYLFLTPEMVDRTEFTFTEWVTIGYLVTVVMLVWLLIWKITLNTEVAAEAVAAAMPVEKPKVKAKAKKPKAEEVEEEEERPPKPSAAKPRRKRVVVASGTATEAHDDELPEGLGRPEDVVDEEIEAMEDMPRVVEYPSKEPGGVYSDTLMKVDDNLILNFRILLGKVCHNCEELEDCKRRVEDKLDEDVFLYNFECKEGIKRELQAARKKREADDEKAEVAKEMVEDKAAKAKEDEEVTDTEEPKKKAPSKKKTTVKKRSTTKKKTSSKQKGSAKGSKKEPADEK